MTPLSALRAEWLKAIRLRSVLLCLAAAFVTAAGVSIAATAAIGRAQAAQRDYDAAVLAFYGLNFGHVAFLVLAVLLTAGEYSRSTLHSSLVAVPRRGVFLAAKVAVGAVLVLVTATLSALVSFFGTQALLGPAAVTLAHPGMLRATVAAAVYPTLVAVVCMGVGTMMRDQAAVLGLLVPFFFLVSPLLELVPVLRSVAVFLPDRAGQVAVRLHAREFDVFGPLAGMGVLALWAGAAVLAAWWALRRRDA